MRPVWLAPVSMGTYATAACSVFAQGVPIHDAREYAKKREILAQQEKDHAVQTKKQSTRDTLERIEKEQLAELDKLLATTKVPTSVETTVEELEAGSDSAKAADKVYPPDDTTDAGQKMFGDARMTVEQVIIQAAKETHRQPGVSAAGLSEVQWRCLIQALIWQESRFNPNAQSPVGAYGLTQIMPTTAPEVGISNIHAATPLEQARGGAIYLARQIARFNGDIVKGLAAYNAGLGNVIKYEGVPPFKETRHYVVVIPNKYNAYLAKVGGVDALGTIEPGLAAAANTAMMANGSAQYGSQTHSEIKAIAARLRSIITRIKSTENETASVALNTYARAELVRLFSLYSRVRSANAQQISAQTIEVSVDSSLAQQFLKFGE